jgi:hypothetical protein
MFCLIYFSDKPNVLEISQSKQTIMERLVDKSIQQCIDEIGQKNFVNTLDNPEPLTEIAYPVFPNFGLKKVSEDKVEVYKIEKKQIVERGYIYNSSKDVVESSLVGTYYVVPVDNWKYEDLAQRPQEEPRFLIRPVETKIYNNPSVQSQNKTKSSNQTKNYDKVLLELIEAIQKRKIE